MRRALAWALPLSVACAGCSWVPLTDAGSEVVQATAADVQSCRSAGVVSAATRDRMVLRRGSAKVREELIVLARNEAAELGANAIVPVGEPRDGAQKFNAYICD